MFKTGDLVQLKSGGPVMTVMEKVPVSDNWLCAWFTSKHNLRTGCFLPGMLVTVDRSSVGEACQP